MSDGLTPWLTERLTLDAAEIATDHGDKAWHARGCEALPDLLYPDREPGACDCGVPARLLLEIEAKRQLLDEHSDVNDGSCGTCVDGDWGYPTHGGSSPQRHPCKTLRLLALPYATRVGYQEGWRP